MEEEGRKDEENEDESGKRWEVKQMGEKMREKRSQMREIKEE